MKIKELLSFIQEKMETDELSEESEIIQIWYACGECGCTGVRTKETYAEDNRLFISCMDEVEKELSRQE